MIILVIKLQIYHFTRKWLILTIDKFVILVYPFFLYTFHDNTSSSRMVSQILADVVNPSIDQKLSNGLILIRIANTWLVNEKITLPKDH